MTTTHWAVTVSGALGLTIASGTEELCDRKYDPSGRRSNFRVYVGDSHGCIEVNVATCVLPKETFERGADQGQHPGQRWDLDDIVTGVLWRVVLSL